MEITLFCEHCEMDCLHTVEQTPSKMMVALAKLLPCFYPDGITKNVIQECGICGRKETQHLD